MSKHTKEPWNDKLIKVCFVELGKLGVHVTIPHYPDEEAKENARRIVACVNACDGIKTDGLEKLVLRDNSNILEFVGARRRETRDERRGYNQLLAKVSIAIDRGLIPAPSSKFDEVDNRVLIELHDVIAKAKGGAK